MWAQYIPECGSNMMTYSKLMHAIVVVYTHELAWFSDIYSKRN